MTLSKKQVLPGSREHRVSQLLVAIEAGNIKTLKKWHEAGEVFKGTAYNLVSTNNRALIHAAKFGHLPVIKWLIEVCGQKIVVVYKTKPGLSNIQAFLSNEPGNAIFVATSSRHYKAAGWMLQKTTSAYDVTPVLVSPAIHGDVEFVQWLLSNYSPQIANSKIYIRACECAAQHGHLEIVKLLINAEKNLLLTRKIDYFSVFMQAIYGNWLDIIKWMVVEPRIRMRLKNNNYLAIKTAGEVGHLETVVWLVEESGQIIDCLDCEDKSWEDGAYGTAPFGQWPSNCQVYFQEVKLIQNSLGLDKWLTSGVETLRNKRSKLQRKRRV